MSKITENAITVLERRYLHRNENNEIDETVEEMFWRVANTIASAEKEYGWDDEQIKTLATEFYDSMTNLDFMPNSPTLMNAGLPLGQLSACFVLPIEDSMEKIFEAVKHTALIHKSGGGTGFSFSRLRPQGSTVQSTGGVASGPISFMKVFNMATEAVKQGGKRRGANMGILRVDHPDILDFIKAKEENSELTNFNLSVWLTDDFMEALGKGEEYPLIDPSKGLKDDKGQHSGEEVGRLNAKEVFDIIVDKAWHNGEPGVIFMDKINAKNPIAHYGSVESTNPCGEQPLLPYESCNLGSINLLNMYDEENGIIDYDKLSQMVRMATRFLDDVIDKNQYPIPEIGEMTRKSRKIGLGIMGFADLLICLNIPYNSEQAVECAREISAFVEKVSQEESMRLAKEKGTFPLYKGSMWQKKKKPMRNATTTTIAPTGTISMIAGCSSGVEPLFGIAYYKLCMDGDKLVEVHPYFEKIAKERGFYSEELMKKIVDSGNVADLEEIPEDVRKVFVTTRDISPEWHIRIQAAFQEHTDNAVSKTINFPFEATREDIYEAYLLAYKLGCKGLTVYRDGSREEQVLNIGAAEKKAEAVPALPENPIAPRQRPSFTQGMTEKAIAGCGNLYITVNYDECGPCEVFTNLGKGGGCPSQTEATARLASLALRSGIEPTALIEQLKGIRCPSTLARKGRGANITTLSCPDAIARTLQRVLKINNGNGSSNVESQVADNHRDGIDLNRLASEIMESEPMEEKQHVRGGCPECGSTLEHEGGCVLCRTCGYSKCG